MKILYLVSNSSLDISKSTGYSIHINETVNGFRAQGHEVFVLTAGNFNQPNGELRVTPHASKTLIKKLLPQLLWETFRDWALLRADRSFRSSVKEAIESFQPDVIYERTSYLTRSASMLAKSFDIPCILEVNSPFVEQRISISGPSFLTHLARSFERDKYASAAGVICVSSALESFLKNEFQVRSDKLMVNPNGVDLGRFNLSSNPEDSSYTFGFAGSIMPYHGIEMLLESFSLVVKQHPTSTLLIVGDGQYLDQLRRISAQLGIEDRVHFTGGVQMEEVARYLNRVDVCIMPRSNWYGSPVKIFEYGALGKPIIAPNVVPVKDVMVHEEDGLLVDGKEELTKAMIWMIEHHSSAQEIAERFHKKTVTKYTWEENVRRALKFMKSVSIQTD